MALWKACINKNIWIESKSHHKKTGSQPQHKLNTDILKDQKKRKKHEK